MYNNTYIQIRPASTDYFHFILINQLISFSVNLLVCKTSKKMPITMSYCPSEYHKCIVLFNQQSQRYSVYYNVKYKNTLSLDTRNKLYTSLCLDLVSTANENILGSYECSDYICDCRCVRRTGRLLSNKSVKMEEAASEQSCADQMITTQKHLRISVLKYFGFSTQINGKLINTDQAVCQLKSSCLTLEPQQVWGLTC